jgi:hypothetical protein
LLPRDVDAPRAGFEPRVPRGYGKFRSAEDRDFVISGTDDPGLRPRSDDEDVDDADVIVLADPILLSGSLSSPGSHFRGLRQPYNVEMAREAQKALDDVGETKAAPPCAPCYAHFDC